MKTILITAIAALLSGEAVCQVAESKAVPAPETASQKVRNPWLKSKAFLSDEPSAYRDGAQQTLAELGKEINAVERKVGATPPVYFQTRLQSLKQQHLQLTANLLELNGEVIKTRQTGPRFAFDRCLSSLEEALNQAAQDVEFLVKVSSSEKQQ